MADRYKQVIITGLSRSPEKDYFQLVFREWNEVLFPNALHVDKESLDQSEYSSDLALISSGRNMPEHIIRSSNIDSILAGLSIGSGKNQSTMLPASESEGKKIIEFDLAFAV